MKRLFAMCGLLVIFAIAPQTHAAWLSAFGGYNTYSMSDVNDELNALNDLIYPLTIDEINGGPSYGVGFGIPVSPQLDLVAYYERLSASSDVGDATGSIEYDFAANTYKAGLVYNFPSTSSFRVGLGGLIGIVSSAGELSITETGEGSVSGGVSGSDLLVEGVLNADYWASPRVAVFGAAGLRYAKIGEIEVRGNPIYAENGDRYTVDYTGLSLRVGIKIDISSRK